jgi:hypothetical protein
MENLKVHTPLLNFLQDWEHGLFTMTMEEYRTLPEITRTGMSYYKSMKPK